MLQHRGMFVAYSYSYANQICGIIDDELAYDTDFLRLSRAVNFARDTIAGVIAS